MIHHLKKSEHFTDCSDSILWILRLKHFFRPSWALHYLTLLRLLFLIYRSFCARFGRAKWKYLSAGRRIPWKCQWGSTCLYCTANDSNSKRGTIRTRSSLLKTSQLRRMLSWSRMWLVLCRWAVLWSHRGDQLYYQFTDNKMSWNMSSTRRLSFLFDTWSYFVQGDAFCST